MKVHAAELALIVAMVVIVEFHVVSGNGRLLEPPQRSSLWRDPKFYSNRNVFRNYNDHTLDCGGVWKMILNNGKCGVCGDPWDTPEPRPNEADGIYGRGIIARTYTTDKRYIDATVQVTSSMGGYFEFNICAINDAKAKVDHECFYNHSMRIHSKNRVTSYGIQYFLDLIPGKTGIIELSLEIPEGLECKQCVLRWHWHGANNFGVCKNGRWNKGCGDQSEIYNCADISIINEKDNQKEDRDTKEILTTIYPMKITTAALLVTRTLSEIFSTPASSVTSSETTLRSIATSNATTSTISTEAPLITTEQSVDLSKATAVPTTTIPQTRSLKKTTKQPMINISEQPMINISEQPMINISEQPMINISEQPMINISETQVGTTAPALIANTLTDFATRTMTTGFPELSKEPNVTSQLPFVSPLTVAEFVTTQTNNIFSTPEVPTTTVSLLVSSFVATNSSTTSTSTEVPETTMPIITAELATNITSSTENRTVTQPIFFSNFRENPAPPIQLTSSASQISVDAAAQLENSLTSSSKPTTTESIVSRTTSIAETKTSGSSIQSFADATTDRGSVVIPSGNSTRFVNVTLFVTSFPSVVPHINSSVTLEKSLPIQEKTTFQPVNNITTFDTEAAMSEKKEEPAVSQFENAHTSMTPEYNTKTSEATNVVTQVPANLTLVAHAQDLLNAGVPKSIGLQLHASSTAEITTQLLPKSELPVHTPEPEIFMRNDTSVDNFSSSESNFSGGISINNHTLNAELRTFTEPIIRTESANNSDIEIMIKNMRNQFLEQVTTLPMIDNTASLAVLTTETQNQNDEQIRRNRTIITTSSQFLDASEMFTPVDITVNDTINLKSISPLVNSSEISRGFNTVETTLPNLNEINRTIATISLFNYSLIKEASGATSNIVDTVMHDAFEMLDNLTLDSKNTTMNSLKDNATSTTLEEDLKKTQLQDITLPILTGNNNLVTSSFATFAFASKSEQNTSVSNSNKSGFSGDIMVATLFPFRDILDANLNIETFETNKRNQRNSTNKTN